MVEEQNYDTSRPGGPVPSPSLDFNDNEDIPTELSDSSETHDEGKLLKMLVKMYHSNPAGSLIFDLTSLPSPSLTCR